MTDKTMTLEQVKEAYARGFLAACKWPSPVTQDIDSDAFRVEREEDLSDMTFSQTAERGEAVATVAPPDPEETNEGVRFSLADWAALAKLPARTKLYTAPPPATGVPDQRSDAENWGNALNAAAWLFVDVCPEKSALIFNHAKASLRAAILKYLDLVSATPSPAIDVAAVPYRMCTCHTLDQRKLCADRHQCSMPETQSAIGDAK